MKIIVNIENHETMKTIDELNQFVDELSNEFIENKKVVRGHTWSSLKVEFWGLCWVSIVMSFPKPSDSLLPEYKFAWSAQHGEMNLIVEMKLDVFYKLMSKEYELDDEDWYFEDEFQEIDE